jgi:hypothetical protein
MRWMPSILQSVNYGNGLLLVASGYEFAEIALFAASLLWVVCGAWNYCLDRVEQRRAALRQLAEEQACAQRKENLQLSSLSCDESDRQTQK